MAALVSVAPRAQAQTAPTNAQLIDRILAKAKPGDKLVRDGDILYPVDALREYRGRIGAGRQAASAFFRVSLWPGGNVPYVLDASLGAAERTKFIQAIRELETVAKLSFFPRTSETDYINVFTDPSAPVGVSYSAIGRVGGKQNLSLNVLSNKYTAVHEIMHALGLAHEQSRSDRDNFVTIDNSNIAAGDQSQFALIPDSNNRGTYDFDSVMHYGAFFFAIDPNKPSIIVKAPNQRFQNLIGQSDHISLLDAQGLADVYGSLGPVIRPDNDSFSKPQIISGSSGTATATNKMATAEDSEPSHAGSPPNNSVWFRWIPANNGVVTFTTKGSAIDSVLAAYLGLSVKTLTNVTSNDDVSAGDTSSSITFPAQANAIYYLAVDSSSKLGGTGDIVLNWNQTVIAARIKLTGTIKTAAGAPLSGVAVNLVGSEATNNTTTATTTTNAAGEYSFSNLLSGRYIVTAKKAGFTFAPTSLRVRLLPSATNISGNNNFTANPTPASLLPQMYVSDVTVREGNANDAFLTFNISMSEPSKDTVTVNYATSNGNATNADYTGVRGTLSFAPGTTSLTVIVRLRPDTNVEADETFNMTLSNAAGANIVKAVGVATLLNDD